MTEGQMLFSMWEEQIKNKLEIKKNTDQADNNQSFIKGKFF